ncbi:MAG: DUF5050 domain-containing protein [Candidatus Pelethousia sp.]|nr:DUF5050 domain-containing protein [Candidatus Pelethousia sp.]
MVRAHFAISVFLCILLVLGAGCAAVPAQPQESAAPAQAQATEESAAPVPESPGPVPMEANASRSFPFAALDGGTLYWCTGSGVLSAEAGGPARLFSAALGRNPVVLNGYLYLVEDQTDLTEDVPWPVPADAVTGSSILRIPLGGGEPESIYSIAYINSLVAADNRLYFCTTQDESILEAGGLLSLDAEGGDEQILAEDCSALACVQDGYAYYMGVAEEASVFCRIPLAGGEEEKLLQGEGMPRTPLFYQGDVYYIHYDLRADDAKNNLQIMRLRDGRPEAVGGGIQAMELLGIWDGKLYYTAVSGSDAAVVALSSLDLASLESKTLQENMVAIAALSGDCCAYSADEPAFLATELQLLPLSGGEATALQVADVVESQG